MQRIIFRAIVAGQAAVSGMAHGAKPLAALFADGGSRERSVRIDGNQTARRTIILWRSRKAHCPPRANGSAKAPVKTSPGPSYVQSPILGRAPLQPGRAATFSASFRSLDVR